MGRKGKELISLIGLFGCCHIFLLKRIQMAGARLVYTIIRTAGEFIGAAFTVCCRLMIFVNLNWGLTRLADEGGSEWVHGAEGLSDVNTIAVMLSQCKLLTSSILLHKLQTFPTILL